MKFSTAVSFLLFSLPISNAALKILDGATVILVLFEPRREKTGLRGLQPALTQTSLCSYRWLEARNFEFGK